MDSFSVSIHMYGDFSSDCFGQNLREIERFGTVRGEKNHFMRVVCKRHMKCRKRQTLQVDGQ